MTQTAPTQAPSNDGIARWKTATFALGGTTVALAVLLALQATGRIDVTTLLKGTGGYATAASAPLALGEFKGDAALSSALKDIAGKRLASGPLSYSAPGVSGVRMEGNVIEKVKPGAAATEVSVKVSFTLKKEPGDGLLGVLSSTAAVEGGAGEVASLKMEAMEAAAESALEDLPGALAK